jgi:hypothetical protein
MQTTSLELSKQLYEVAKRKGEPKKLIFIVTNLTF